MTQNFRNTDPPTSVIAGHSMEVIGAAQCQRDRCLAAVKTEPGLTAREIEQRTGIKAHKRLPELRERGLAHNGITRLCQVSGRMAMTWHPPAYLN
ncbi:MAG: helix-turn-helix domain-containing protein [Phycisphaeraceae bacterium]